MNEQEWNLNRNNDKMAMIKLIPNCFLKYDIDWILDHNELYSCVVEIFTMIEIFPPPKIYIDNIMG